MLRRPRWPRPRAHDCRIPSGSPPPRAPARARARAGAAPIDADAGTLAERRPTCRPYAPHGAPCWPRAHRAGSRSGRSSTGRCRMLPRVAGTRWRRRQRRRRLRRRAPSTYAGRRPERRGRDLSHTRVLAAAPAGRDPQPRRCSARLLRAEDRSAGLGAPAGGGGWRPAAAARPRHRRRTATDCPRARGSSPGRCRAPGSAAYTRRQLAASTCGATGRPRALALYLDGPAARSRRAAGSRRLAAADPFADRARRDPARLPDRGRRSGGAEGRLRPRPAAPARRRRSPSSALRGDARDIICGDGARLGHRRSRNARRTPASRSRRTGRDDRIEAAAPIAVRRRADRRALRALDDRIDRRHSRAPRRC